ncbi:hypothetical protein C8R44DRAFT_728089 [Mycena epipterygia]|nr:hypothetical protein C8R44DRAFT_728089 [Mycena epipterygia]
MMEAILSIPDGKTTDDPSREGTEKYPLHIEGVTREEFDDLLGGFLYHPEYKIIADTDKERVYTNLLKLSDKFIMKAGKRYAIKNLEDIYLPPARRLELAGKFGIPQWVEPAVKYILNHKLTELTAEDLALIGLGVYAILVKGKEFMDVEIRRTASRAPSMIQDPSWNCPDHKSCDTTWKRLWRKEIGWKLLHPTFPMKPDEILWTVQKFRDAGLYEKCRDDVIREIRENVIFFNERIVLATSEAIIAYHKKF